MEAMIAAGAGVLGQNRGDSNDLMELRGRPNWKPKPTWVLLRGGHGPTERHANVAWDHRQLHIMPARAAGQPSSARRAARQ